MDNEYNSNLAGILENTEDAIIIKSLDGTIQSWNKCSEKMFGYTSKEMIGKNISLIIPPEFINDDKNNLSRISNNKIVDCYETTIIKKNSAQLHVSLIVFYLKDNAGNITGSYQVARDITSQKKSEAERIEAIKELEFQNTEKEKRANELIIANEELAFQNQEKEKRAAELLIANNKYKYLFDNNPSPLLIFDFETLKILDCNIECLMLYGYSREEFLQLTIKDIRPKEDIEKIIEATKNESTYGEIHKKVWRHLKKNGELMNVEVTGHLLNYNNRRCSLALINDITDRKKAEEKLSKAADELQKAFNDTNKIMDSSQDIICVVDKDGYFVKVSAACEAIWGYKPEELIGKPLINYVYKMDNEKTQITADVVMSGKSIKHFENRYIRKDGSLVPMEWTARWDETDKLRYGVARDITNRKIAEEKIKESENRMRLVTSSAAMGIWYWDIKNDNMVWDKRMYQIYDINESHLGSVYEGFLSRLHPEDKDRVNELMQSGIADKKREYSSEFRIIWDDLSVHYIKGTGTIAFDDNGNVIQMMGVNWDVTAEKEKEQHLKLLESVITNTTDAVLITEAEPFDEPGPRILYVNDAFTKMTGYTAEEVIGKTPRILQGPKSDKAELKRLSEAIRRWETCEITIINYKKNGEEFWINFILTPVANEKGWYTHWISIDRDVTIRKNEELQNKLIADISTVFSESLKLHETIDRTLRYIADFGDFCFAEAWLAPSDQNILKKISNHATTENMSLFIEETNSIDTFIYGEGFTGVVAKTKEITIWRDLANQKLLRRRDAALKYGLKTIIGLPLLYNNEVIGVLAFGLDHEVIETAKYLSLFKKLGDYLSPEIKRKQLELELNQMFNFAPDLIIIIGLDGCFKRVNPAACQLLGYTQEEMCTIPYVNFIHPEDKEKSTNEVAALLETNLTYYFENRYITKSGKIKWLAWNAIYVTEDNNIYAVAKDITEKKELENLLEKANSLARIGNWDVDLIKQTVYWSDITREIHEAESSFVPDLATGINFYKEGASRELITQKVKEAIEVGKPFDEELEIVTAKNNVRWIRTIGETEFVDGKCVKIYGSFQDIDQRKRAEEKLIESLNRYRRLFDTSPIAITEEDHTPFYEKIECLRASGISKNYATYFHNHGEELYEMLGRVQIHGVNQSLLDLTGANNLEDFVANRSKFFVSMTEMTVFKLMDLIRDGGGYFEEETKIKSLSGEIKEVVVRLKYPAAPPYNSIAITMRDVTKQKESEQAIKKSEEKFRALVIASSDLVYRMSPDWSVMYQLDGRGFIADTLKPNSNWIQEYIFPNNQPDVMAVIKEAIRTKSIFELEHPVLQVDGTMGWTFSRAVPLFDEKGAIVEWFGAASDITERKKAEEKIKESEEKFRALVENNDSIIGMFDEHLNPIYRSPSAYRILGWTMEEKANDEQLSHVHPDDRELFKNTLKELMANPGKAVKKSVRLKHKNGNWVMLEGTITNLLHNSSVKAIVSNIQDVTERKKAESKLIENENYLRTILDNEPECVKVLNSKGELLSINPAGLAMIEADNEQQVLGHRMTELVNKKYWRGFNRLSAAVFKGNSGTFEFEITGLKGRHRWLETHAVPLKDTSGKIVNLLGVTRDITARKKADQEIKNTEERRKLIMNAALDAIICIDKDGMITFWNPQAEQIFGWSENEVMGKLLSAIIIPEHFRSMHDNGMKNYLKTGKGLALNVLLQLSAIRRNGTEFPIELTVLPIRQDGEEFFCAFIRDITERKTHEEQLLKLNENLKKQKAELITSNKELEQFAYVASHDLQEPLRMVTSFLTLLEKRYNDVLDEKGLKYINFAVEGSKSMRQIILDILEFSRINNNEENYEFIDLKDIIKDISLLQGKLIKEKKAKIIFEELPKVYSIRHYLMQLFQNIISNALKYSKEDVPLEIFFNSKEYKNYYQIAITDNGIGIEKEYYEKIFIIFKRLHGKEKYEGNGMGLAIAKKIVKKLNGKIWVKSKIGVGSTFYINIPKK